MKIIVKKRKLNLLKKYDEMKKRKNFFLECLKLFWIYFEMKSDEKFYKKF